MLIRLLLLLCTAGAFGQPSASISKGPIKCKSLKNRPYQAKPTLVDINSKETLF